jgi:hypothetical protein
MFGLIPKKPHGRCFPWNVTSSPTGSAEGYADSNLALEDEEPADERVYRSDGSDKILKNLKTESLLQVPWVMCTLDVYVKRIKSCDYVPGNP